MPNYLVEKVSIFSRRDRVTFAAIAVLFLFFFFRYAAWWFDGAHLPYNWGSTNLHLLDILIFALLSFVVFIGSILSIGSMFVLWHGSVPKYGRPQEGLRVGFLTCFVPGKEPVEMLVETLLAMKKVDYPHDTWVLDEGNSEQVKEICQRLDVFYFSRYGIEKYNQEKGKFRARTKAGNHNSWADCYARDYDIIAQIDMDHVPGPDFFEKTLGFFRDPKVGFVGMPQFYKNTENWIARGAAEQSFYFHGPMQKGFYGCDMPFLIGTSHIYRTSAMEQIGGYAPTIVEDHLTGMNFYAYGWKGVFIPEILARGEGPFNWVDYFNQQMRWSYGLFEIFFKHTPRIIRKLKWKAKINYLVAQLYYFTGVAVVIGFLLTFLYLVFGIRSADMNLWEWIAYSSPPFLLSLTFQIYAHKFRIDPDNEPVLGLLGMFLNLGANLIYALAFVKFICAQKLRYMVTQKGSRGRLQRIPLATFRLHIIFAALMCFALINSFFSGHGAIQLRFWALFSTVTLTAVVLSIYSEVILPKFWWLNPSYSAVRYAYRLALVLIIFGAFMFTFPFYGPSVKAIFERPFNGNFPAVVTDEGDSVAGKVSVPTKGAYLGVSLYQHNDTDSIAQLQGEVGKRFAVVGYYQSWGVADNAFDKQWAGNIHKNGSVPMITWEPWVPISGFDRSESVVDQEEYRLRNIIDGKYDDYILQYAQDVKFFKKQVMIRFAHEMNGNWYPWGSTFNKPEEYVLAWRHVHEIFDSVGAVNVSWVWSPNEIYYEKLVPNAYKIELFYPGDDYVDWVGFSVFNWAGSYKQNLWRNPGDLFDETLSALRAFNKPIMITETASAEDAKAGTRKAEWINKLSVYIESKPEIKGLVWFNTVDNGVDWGINSSNASAIAFGESFADYYIQGNLN